MKKRSSRSRTSVVPSPPTDLFRIAFNNSPAMQTLTRTTDRVLVEVNDAFLRTLGYTRDEVIGRTALELSIWVHPERAEPFRAQLAADGTVRGFEVEIRSKSGKVLTVLLSADRVEIDGVPHVMAAGVDISDRKEIEARLRESETRVRENEARIRALYESISAAVVVQDETGFIQVNSASLALFGTDKMEEILGRHPSAFSAPRQPDGEDSAVAARRHIEHAFTAGSHRFAWLARRLDGVEFPAEVTLTALQLEGRRVLQAVVIDLTESKRAEAELQNALAKERELHQLKGDFVSLVSHEFRTPLEVIMSSADNLERYHDRLPEDKRTHLLRTIRRSVTRMSGMMEEVLLLGRLEADRTEFQPASVDLAAFCRRVADEMETATGHRCPITVETGEFTGPARADEAVLRHIVTNLLSNAVKYSPAGRAVKLAVLQHGAEAEFIVADQGCGIPAADQARLFQAFHRGSNVRHVPGTGLGLVIVQRSVALHGGSVAVESLEDEGTTFTVRLPLFEVQS